MNRFRMMFLEPLEDRRLLCCILASEQLFAYMLNRARHDPVTYQNEQSLSVDLSGVTPRPPLAVNNSLYSSAGFKAEEMATRNYFGHTSPYTGYPNKLTRSHGYALDPSFADNSNQVESLAGGTSTAISTLNTLIIDAGVSSLGHRKHLLGIDSSNAANREIGVGYGYNASATYRYYWAIHATRSSSSDQFLTGVAYNDSNGNQRYDANEGLSGVTVTADQLSTVTNAAGGWSIPVSDGEYLVSASGGLYAGVSSVPVVVTGDSIEVDFISGLGTGYADFDLWENTAPSLNPNPSPTLPPVLVNNSDPPGAMIARIVGDSITDPDPKRREGIAVSGLTQSSNGTWQYSPNSGGSWTNFGSVSANSARLLQFSDLVRFVPDAGFIGSATITYHAWDQTSGSTTELENLSGNTGGTSAFSTASATAMVTVITQNTAPLLNDAANPKLTTITEDSSGLPGNTVGEIVGSAITDPDPGAAVGVAVVGVTGQSNGSWKFSRDAGETWTAIGSVSANSARLLGEIDRILFVPNTDFNGSATITYHAWDQMSGTVGGQFDLSGAAATGGQTAFSVKSDMASISVTPVNDAPVILDPGDLKLNPVPPNLSFPIGQTVASFLKNVMTDVDSNASEGIAIIGRSGSGTFWFNTGSWWSGTMSPNFAPLLRANDLIGFTPDTNSNGSGIITFRVWDQTTGPDISGRWANLSSASSVGGTTAYSVGTASASVAVGETTRPTVHSITRLDTSPTSAASVSFRVTFSEAVERVDVDDFVATTTSSVSASVASISGSGAIYSVAVGSITGVGTLGLEFASAHQNIQDLMGNSLNLSSFAGSQIYTIDNGTPGNNAPVLDNSGSPTLTAVDEGETNPPGNTIASVVGTSISDPDNGALEGVALIALSGTGNGVWQFSTNGGGSWTAVGSVATNSARLLRDNDKLRFLPNVDFNGTASVSYYAWDQTSGTAGSLANALTRGGTTAFSTASDVASITVTPVNNIPVLATLPALTLPENGAIHGNATKLADFVSDIDSDKSKIQYRITNLNSIDSRFGISIDMETNSDQFAARTSNAIHLHPATNFNGQATVIVQARDLEGGLSQAQAFTVTVTPVNDPPTLAALSDLTLDEDADEQTVHLAGITAGVGESQPLRVTASSNNTDLIPDPSVIYTSAESSGSIKFTPVIDQSGSAVITVTVEDGGLDGDLSSPSDNATSSLTFDVTVNPVNKPPTLDPIADLTVDEDAVQQTISLSDITAGSNESQPLRVTAFSSNTNLIPNPTVIYTSAEAAGSIKFTPAGDASGSTVITVTVEDGGWDGDLDNADDNLSHFETFTVTVTPVNDVPTLASFTDLKFNPNASEQTVDLSGITAGGGEDQPLRVTASSNNTDLIPDPSVIYTSAESSGSITFTPVIDQSGSAVITVTVEDGGLDGDLETTADNAVVSNDFNVSIGIPPTLDTPSDPTINEDAAEQTVSLTGITAGGGESQPLRVTAFSSNTNLIPNPTVIYTSAQTTGSLKFTPASNASGSAVITVTVEDGGLDRDLNISGDNLTRSRLFTVTVHPVNDVPTLASLPNLTLAEDVSEQTVNLSGITAGGNEIQPLRVTASSSNTSLIPHPTVTYTSAQVTGSLKFTPTSNASGSAVITVTVEDGGLDGDLDTTGNNLTRSMFFTVTVHPVAVDDFFAVAQDSQNNPLAVLQNDVASSNGALIIVAVGTPDQGGSVSIAPDGSQLFYTPANNFTSPPRETFTYTVGDSPTVDCAAMPARCSMATVQVEVQSIFVDPIAIDDYREVVGANANLSATVIDVLANDIMGRSGPLTLVPSGLNTTGTTGRVRVDVATNRILYTPAAGFYNLDSFSYTVTDTHNTTRTANVTVQVSKAGGVCSPNAELASCDDGINFIVETINPVTGLPITSPLDVGQEFEVRVSVQDARVGILPSDAGIFSAFMDVLYDADFVDVKPSANPITLGDNYQNFSQGVVGAPGVVNELGAMQQAITPLGNGMFELASMIFIAKAEGTATIQLDPADVSPVHDSLVRKPDSNHVIDHAIISYGSRTVTVNPTGSGPVALDDFFMVVQDSQNNPLVVLQNDVASSNGALIIVAVGTPDQGGSVSIAPNGSQLFYTPTNNFTSPPLETFTYTVGDSPSVDCAAMPSRCSTATVQVEVQSTFVDPIAIDDYREVFGAAVNPPATVIDVLANDIMGKSRPLTLVPSGLNTTGTTGSVQVDVVTNRILYTPAAGFYNLDSFSYTATDAHNTTRTANVTVQVSKAGGLCSPNAELASCDDGINFIVETIYPVTGLPITSPLDVGQEFEVRVSVQDARVGILPSDAGVYAAFMDVLFDAVFVDVKSSVNPITFGDNYQKFSQGVVGAPGVVNELGAMQQAITPLGNGLFELASMIFIAKAEGTATIQLDPADVSPVHNSLVHEPASNQVIDHAIISYGSRTVTVNPAQVNDIPTLASLSNLTINENASEQTVNLFGITAGGNENQPLQVTASSSNKDLIPNPSVLYTSANSTGSIQFTPLADANGSTVITVTVEDGGWDRELATSSDNATSFETFSVTVRPVEDTPRAMDGSYQANENELLFVTAENGLIQFASDPDGDPLTFVLVAATSHGHLSLADDGSLTYRPTTNFNRSDSFRYTANDGTANSNEATITLSIKTDYPWYNAMDRMDVSDDGQVSPLDALLVIDKLNADGPQVLSTERGEGIIAPFHDVNRDGRVNSTDALMVINDINVTWGPKVQIDLVATDQTGSPITEVNEGDTFWVTSYLKDLRPDGTGVRAAYFDIQYPSNLVSVTGGAVFNAPYVTGVHADFATAGLVNEIGASSNLFQLNTDEYRQFRLPMKALSTGTARFNIDLADESPAHDVLLYGDSAAVTGQSIQFGHFLLTILPQEESGEGEAAFNWHELDRSLAPLPASGLSLSDWTTSRSSTSAPVAVVELERPRVTASQLSWQRRIDDAIVDLTGEDEELLLGRTDDLVDSIDGLL